MEDKARLLIVDDEKIALKNLEHVLKKEGYEVTTAATGETGLKKLKTQVFDVVLTDLRMEKVDGLQIVRQCKKIAPDTEVIMITGYATVETAINALKHGAYHYIAKPFKLDEVRKVVKEAAEKVALKRENRKLKDHLANVHGKEKIITRDRQMKHLLELAREIAPSDCNTLITGESGTGKELVARYIHDHSKRGKGPFIAVNCGAFSEDLLANELFGHEQGAFTGAAVLKKGLVEVASGGTLFLDEIMEMTPSMQVKLLRVIQEKEYPRIGGTRNIRVDVRFIAATNRDIQKMTESGAFRQDLFYRLNVVTLLLPPLSERKSDIPLLAYHFLKKYAAAMEKDVSELSEEVMNLLQNYNFPGNIRELENIIERGVALAQGKRVEISCLPDDLTGIGLIAFRQTERKFPSLEDQEKAYIGWVLEKVKGNKTRAAEILGIDRVSLWRKLKKFRLEGGTGAPSSDS